MSKHLGAKAAFKYTYTWNKTFGELVGMYPKFKPSNAERYRRGSVFFKALMREMKVQNVGTIYRGLSKSDAEKFMSNVAHGSKMERNTFTSFSHKLDIAKHFSNIGGESMTILRISGKIPCVDYTQTSRYKSHFPNEAEVLLPPGSFEFIDIDINTVNRYTIFDVKFTPKPVNVSAFAKNANKKYNYSKVVNNKTFNNTNVTWNREKLNNLLKSQQQKFENLKKLRSMNETKNAVQRANRKIRELIQKDTKRIEFIQKRLKKKTP